MTAISREHQKRVRAPYLSWEEIATVVDDAVGIDELEATVRRWSSETFLNVFSEITHVDTL